MLNLGAGGFVQSFCTLTGLELEKMMACPGARKHILQLLAVLSADDVRTSQGRHLHRAI